MLKCKFCSKECKNGNSHRNHERMCKLNPDRVLPEKTEKWKEAMRNRVSRNQFTKARDLGLKIPEVSEETRLKISNSLTGRVMTDEYKAAHSEIMREVVRNNPDSYSKNNVCGRVKMIEYRPGVMLKGSWEVKVAEWLDSINVVWESEVNPQPYFWNASERMYFPDFYLPEYEVYIEVKGYKTERDDAKWNQFNGRLLIIDKKSINCLYEYDIELAISELLYLKN